MPLGLRWWPNLILFKMQVLCFYASLNVNGSSSVWLITVLWRHQVWGHRHTHTQTQTDYTCDVPWPLGSRRGWRWNVQLPGFKAGPASYALFNIWAGACDNPCWALTSSGIITVPLLQSYCKKLTETTWIRHLTHCLTHKKNAKNVSCYHHIISSLIRAFFDWGNEFLYTMQQQFDFR